ncbi:MAG: hypothetical protein ABMA00_20470 [Gemmatimonas sp.]
MGISSSAGDTGESLVLQAMTSSNAAAADELSDTWGRAFLCMLGASDELYTARSIRHAAAHRG